MRFILFTLGALAVLGGLFFFANAVGAVHEIEGLIMFLIASVLIVGGAIVEAQLRSRRESNPWLKS